VDLENACLRVRVSALNGLILGVTRKHAAGSAG